MTFFREVVGVSAAELHMVRAAPDWASRLAAAHTIPREFADGDYAFEPGRFEGLSIPLLLLVGGDSPPILRIPTDAVHAALPASRVAVMAGQGHVAISTAPELFARLVVDFLTEGGEGPSR